MADRFTPKFTDTEVTQVEIRSGGSIGPGDARRWVLKNKPHVDQIVQVVRTGRALSGYPVFTVEYTLMEEARV